MRIRHLALQHFRNLELTRLELGGGRLFLLGPNGMGKTNFLEALGFITALRSFRSSESRVLIAQGQGEATLVFELEHERQGATRLQITLRGDGKEVTVDETRVGRLADFVGLFPTVVFSSQDHQLIRGAPGGRRRWLDLSLSAVDADYLRALQAYHRALEDRNTLLKRGTQGAELTAFDRAMAPAASLIVARRAAGLAAFAQSLTEAYALIADHAEPAAFAYAPDWEGGSAEAFVERLAKNRERDLRQRSTSCGPHRDDFEFTLQGRQAKDFASEGQQRLLVIALRLAQAAWFREKSGLRPVILADDVVGELDPQRRARFWKAIDPEAQIIATGTELPPELPGDWRVLRVENGALVPHAPVTEAPF
jgi:DNA replication and repair protein RecF